MKETVAVRAVALCEAVTWIAKLNALWLTFTLLGGVVLGIGPSTVAAFDLSRRYHQGESPRMLPAFWATYRTEFGRATLLVVPNLLVGAMLALNFHSFGSAFGSASTVLSMATVALGACFVASVCVLLPMFSHYDLPLRRYHVTAMAFALRNPVSMALLLFVTIAIGYLSYSLPGLLLFFSVGAWIHLDNYLCLKMFAANDAAVAARA
ncbi:YesL family protein [Actinopolymorpha pittospori]|uniref:Membrane protein YesL n=1 Tax=Actinopolymorpha pittospori TaxID=648752 RepID=A0A927RDW2_9ACTN|nr:DUF624 domain-containing protein [Actinopolymorpha pittospori]MBE1608565.1 putative membrane protein YesL [Actinopolymorpha pittospori]